VGKPEEVSVEERIRLKESRIKCVIWCRGLY